VRSGTIYFPERAKFHLSELGNDPTSSGAHSKPLPQSSLEPAMIRRQRRRLNRRCGSKKSSSRRQEEDQLDTNDVNADAFLDAVCG
jgi:hypothetical protein